MVRRYSISDRIPRLSCGKARLAGESGSVESQWELVTPDMAAEYLEANRNNRKLRKSLVNRLAADIAAGSYQLTHQGVAFDDEGVLLDGQHRLAAIVQAGVACFVLVTRGLPRQSQLVMDDHAKRDAADSIHLATGADVTRDDIAIVRILHSLKVTSGDRQLTRAMLMEAVDRIRDGLAFAKPSISERGTCAACARAGIVSAYYYVQDLERLRQFDRILLGRSMAEGPGEYAAQLARELIISGRLPTHVGGMMTRRSVLKKLQRLIHAFMSSERITKVYEPDKAIYPWPLEDAVR